MTLGSRIPGWALTLVAVATLTVAPSCNDEPQVLVGYEVAPAPQVGDLTLTDTTTGETAALRADDGELLVAFLGFTNCPDVCPLALADLRTALDQLDDPDAPIDVAMVTVDPRRDTPEVLTEFVRRFVPTATGLRTEDQVQLRAVVDGFGATAESSHDHTGHTLEVGHTDYTYVIDDTGEVVLTWTRDMDADDIANDLRILLDRLPTL